MFTYNNPPNNDISYLTPHVKYAIVGFEIAPTTGTPHHQGYVELKKQHRLTSLRKLIDRPIHWEIIKGSPLDNITYCKKSGTYEELGTHRNTSAVDPKEKRSVIRKQQFALAKETLDITAFIDNNIHDIAWPK